MGQMNQMGPNHMGQAQFANPQFQQMFSPSNYDPLMIQQMAPVQNNQAFQSMGMPANVKSMPDVSRMSMQASQPMQPMQQPAQPVADPNQFSLRQNGGGVLNKKMIQNLANLAKSSIKKSRRLI